MSIRLSMRLLSIVVLLVVAAAGVALVLHATPEGLALTDDSIAYIAGARSMLAGDGYREAWLASDGPVTHFPPGYPSALAFLGLFGLELRKVLELVQLRAQLGQLLDVEG